MGIDPFTRIAKRKQGEPPMQKAVGAPKAPTANASAKKRVPRVPRGRPYSYYHDLALRAGMFEDEAAVTAARLWMLPADAGDETVEP